MPIPQTDAAQIARFELGLTLELLAEIIEGSENFEKATDAVLALANSFYRAGKAAHEVRP